MSKISFEVMQDENQKILIIDGVAFDWALDDESIEQANLQKNLKAVHGDIQNHFLDSLEEVLGFRPTMKQVNDAIKEGFI